MGEQQLTPNEEEILSAMYSMKNNKAPGEDGISAELLKCGGREVEAFIIKLIQSAWEHENIPEDWRSAIIVPVHKKGEKTVCNNYRGIALLNVAYKIMTKLIARRMDNIMKNIV